MAMDPAKVPSIKLSMVRHALMPAVLAALICGGLSGAAWADCPEAAQQLRAALAAGDLDGARRLHDTVWREPACDDVFRGRAGRAVSLLHARIAQERLAAGANLDSQRGLLERGLEFGRTWPVLALLGDAAHDARDFGRASALYQEALAAIDDAVKTPKPPPPTEIERIFLRAGQSRMLAAEYRVSPRTRSGAPAGLAAARIRGFTVERVPLPISFHTGSAEFTSQGRRAAADMTGYLKMQNPPNIAIAGHTDPRGAEAYNLDLSRRRAEAVAAYLREQGFKGRIDVIAKGERERFPGRARKRLYAGRALADGPARGTDPVRIANPGARTAFETPVNTGPEAGVGRIPEPASRRERRDGDRRRPVEWKPALGSLRRGSCFGWPMRALTVAGMLAVAGVPGIGAAAFAAPPAVRGLVIGIDDYRQLNDLAGAVNDARDIAGALSSTGVTDLVVLENGAATRQRIVAEWRALMARAAPGDTLVLSYAGHGGQEPAQVPGTERDGLDEVLLLGGFQSAGAGTRERIFDNELNQWFLEAGARELRVIFVADSCHAGTLTRSLDPRTPVPVFRTARYTISDDMLELEVPEGAAALDEGELAHVSFLAAGQEHEQVPEITLPGKTGRPEARGALSYMFARAIEGQADLDGDGMLRRAELWRFVRENVRMMTEARQTPNLLPNGRGGEPILRLAPSPAQPAAGAAAQMPGPTSAVRLAVLHAAPPVLATARNRLPGVRMVSTADSPDLIWDAATRQVVTGMGDVAAHGVDLAGLEAVIGKWEAVRAIAALSARASLRLRVHPHDGTHPNGAEIEVVIDGLRHPRLTLFALSGSGIVQYLYPRAGDPATVPPGQAFRLPLQATPPFGADHIVAVSASRPLDALNAALERLDGQAAPRRAAELLADAAAGSAQWWSGIQGLFTAP